MTDKPPREAKARRGRAKKQRPPPKRGKNVVKGLVPEVVVTLTNAQERFCQLKAGNVLSNTECYLQAHPTVSRDVARAGAWETLTNPAVLARIEWYRAEARKNVKITLEEQLLWYQSVRDTPVGELDENSPLAQEVERTISGTEEKGIITKVKVKSPDKLAAAKQIDELMGFKKPQELSVTMSYEPPNKAMERLQGRGVDLAAILKKAGITETEAE